jgi:hypothetical protein
MAEEEARLREEQEKIVAEKARLVLSWWFSTYGCYP